MTNQSLINNSALGGEVISSESGYYYLYAGNAPGSNLGGIPVDFVLYNTSYPDTDLPAGNGVIYASSATGTTPVTPPDGGTPVPPSIVPQSNQVAPQQPNNVLAQDTPQNAPFPLRGTASSRKRPLMRTISPTSTETAARSARTMPRS